MDKRKLELYTDYLISNYGCTTATGLSAMVNGAVNHDQITRFLSERNTFRRICGWRSKRRCGKSSRTMAS